MDASICDAINRRAIIEFDYGGSFRAVEPYVHGNSSAGNEVLRGYQLRGVSKSGNPEGWRLYKVDEISALRVTKETFTENRADYNPNDKTIAIHCRV